MEHQYPVAISPDEHMLAELMLPDQTHVRTQDWTMFFLHKDAASNEAQSKKSSEGAAESQDSASETESVNGSEQQSRDPSHDKGDGEDEDSSEGPPLMYVLNLVNTKQDDTVKR